VKTGRHLRKKRYGMYLAFIGMTERKKECKEKEVDKTAERRLRTPQEEISVCLPR
jgi:hypothetical protein